MSVTKKGFVPTEEQVVGQLYQTTNYDMFKFLEGNREKNVRGFNKIKPSIEENGQWIAVVINKDGYVIDGQHRLWACEELGIPVQYYIKDIPTSMISNIQCESESWELRDFLNSKVKEGKTHYEVLDRLIRKIEEKGKFGLNISNYITIFSSDSSSYLHKFKTGEFTISQARIDRGMKVIELYGIILKGENLKGHNIAPLNKTTSLFRALAYIVEYKDFDFDRMKRKMKKTYVEKPKDNFVNAYLNAILKAYNWNEKSVKNKLYYNDKIGIH